MWVHSAYFWLQREKSEHKLAEFLLALNKLRGIPSIELLWTGTPAPADRPAVDTTYDAGLTVIFKDGEGHAIYQKHPLHQSFLENYRSWWCKVVIYDFK
ncbi:MAG: hypothetical protein A2Y02_00120 [Omnitrophica bacterium GWA2_52_12]|nr:MAG: hypothetical protein A2Y02_00120 [Omnitrophica bacterium GWA2_52_12]